MTVFATTHVGEPDIRPAAQSAKKDDKKRAKTSIEAVRPQSTPQSRAGNAEMYTVVRGDSLTGVALIVLNRGKRGSDQRTEEPPGRRSAVRRDTPRRHHQTLNGEVT